MKVNMKNVLIKKATIEHIGQLQKIGKRTFFEAFSSVNTEENMRNYLENAFSTEQLMGELSDKNSEFYFASIDKRVIGYLKINFGQTEIKEAHTLEIERIYVLKDFQGKKIGQLLCEKAIDIAKQKKVNYIWLGVWEENPRAIRFYEKNSFKEFDKHIFKLGDDEQKDIVMKLQIN